MPVFYFARNLYKNRSYGFSMIELILVVAVISILTTMAAPSFRPLMDKWRIDQTVDSMKSTIYFARSEGIKRNGKIAVQKMTNQQAPGCKLAETNQDWGCGWFVFEDVNEDGRWQTSEEIFQSTSISPHVNVTHGARGGANIKINRYGMMAGLNAKGFIFSPTHSGISSRATRGLCMSSGGRIRVIEDVPCV